MTELPTLKPVAISGMGLVTSLGHGVTENWTKLLEYQSGVRAISRFCCDELPVGIAATLPARFDNKSSRERASEAAVLAVEEAIDQAGLDRSMFRSLEVVIAAAPFDHDWDQRLERYSLLPDGTYGVEAKNVEPAAESFTLDFNEPQWKFMRDATISSLWWDMNRRFGIERPPVMVHTACSSGNSAIQIAQEIIHVGQAERVLVLGFDASVTPESLTKFALLGALSARDGDPAQAARPFSIDRGGFVMGEAVGALVLESTSALKRREHPAIAGIVGAGESVDVYHRTRSDPEASAIVTAIERALHSAALAPSDIDFINAHGTGTVENDLSEAVGICKVFGTACGEIPVTSNKSQIGHCLSAAGVCEAIFTALTCQTGILPPTLNCRSIDPEIPLNIVRKVEQGRSIKFACSNSFGFGGQNVVLVLAAADVVME